MPKDTLSSNSVSGLLAKEITLLGERMGQAINECRNDNECAAIEDALQSLTAAKSTLERAGA